MKNKKLVKEDDRTKLILHFNVEGTLLVRRSEYFYNVEFFLKSLICSQIWGTIEEKGGELIFNKLDQIELEYDKANLDQENKLNLFSYMEFLDKKYALKQIDIDNQEEDTHYNDDMLNKKIKCIIDVKEKNQPAQKFGKQLEEMKKRLRVDEKITQDYALKIDSRTIDLNILREKVVDSKFDFIVDSHSNYRYLYRNAYYSIVINFFEMIINLTKAKRRFCVVLHFWNMNTENIEETIFEYNSFCNGKHPKFNGLNSTQAHYFDGENGKNVKDLRIKDYDPNNHTGNNVAVFVRNYRNPLKENLIWESIKFTKNEIDDDLRDNIEEYFDGDNEDIQNNKNKLSIGYNQILTSIYEKLSEYSSLAIVEDSSIYKKQKSKGKLILIDPYDYETQHIIFDDDSLPEMPSVDIIDIGTGKKLNNSKCINKFLVRVDIRKAIIEKNYFNNKIDYCENNRQNEIKALNAKEFIDIPNYDDFNIQKMIHGVSCDTYLEMTIFPLLNRVSFN